MKINIIISLSVLTLLSAAPQPSQGVAAILTILARLIPSLAVGFFGGARRYRRAESLDFEFIPAEKFMVKRQDVTIQTCLIDIQSTNETSAGVGV
jgi:hypothetical protein